ncbi:MAG TPA: hypothetical protein VFN31_02000 [Candidatus Saccharimonadales bacterium]|nr:hypothetical protein [Candidatus Saccharimonadales bacterium]
MKSSELVLATIVLVPAIILFWFRINASIVFLSLCLGSVLMQFVSPDAHQFLALFSAHVPKGVDAGSSSIKIFLLLLPPVLSAVMMLKTVKGSNKYLNVLPALGVGILAALLLTPLLSSHLSNSIISSKAWTPLKTNQGAIVGVSSIVCLVTLWIQGPKSTHEKSKHSK